MDNTSNISSDYFRARYNAAIREHLSSAYKLKRAHKRVKIARGAYLATNSDGARAEYDEAIKRLDEAADEEWKLCKRLDSISAEWGEYRRKRRNEQKNNS